jgi:hypothetical protein
MVLRRVVVDSRARVQKPRAAHMHTCTWVLPTDFVDDPTLPRLGAALQLPPALQYVSIHPTVRSTVDAASGHHGHTCRPGALTLLLGRRFEVRKLQSRFLRATSGHIVRFAPSGSVNSQRPGAKPWIEPVRRNPQHAARGTADPATTCDAPCGIAGVVPG